MASWSISNIFATSDHPTSNTHAQVSYRRVEVWNSVNPALYIDPNNNGSTSPVTMNILSGVVPINHAPIEIIGTFAFPPAWQHQQYIVTGWLPSLTVPATLLQRFQSDSTPVPVANNVGNVHVTGFKLGPAGAGFVSPMPFRWAGDFVWKISIVATPPATGIPTLVPTRLELCWARAPAPDGPINVDTRFQRTRVNLGGVYPINLFRYFLPDAYEYTNVNNIHLIQEFGHWYVERMMGLIWGWPQLGGRGRPQYDNFDGKSSHNVTLYGGQFQLDEWIAGVHATCNCYDLAAIVQLGCAILVDQNGEELLNSNWVLQQPTGFINPGPLYGRLTEIDCNSPFWARNGTPANVPVDDPLRSCFARHAWVEVSFGNDDRFVLDATHVTNPNPLPVNYQPLPESGHRSRAAFLQNSLDQLKAHGDGMTSNGPGQPGNCELNPNFRLLRIGVDSAGPNAMLPPLIPDSVVIDIHDAVAVGVNPNPPPAARNAAPLNANRLISFFANGPNPLRAGQRFLTAASRRVRLLLEFNTDVLPTARIDEPAAIASHAQIGPWSITPGGSATSTTTTPDPEATSTPAFKSTFVRNIEPAAGPTDSLIVTIEACINPDESMQALKDYISGFTNGPLKAAVQRPVVPLGDFSFQTPTTVFWVRGDVFIIFATSNPTNKKVSIPSLLTFASQLDKILAANTAPVTAPGPAITFSTPPPTKVKKNDGFTVKISSDSKLVDECVAVSDDSKVVLPAGPPRAGTFTFFSRDEGDTTVTILAADLTTLRPASAQFKISVK